MVNWQLRSWFARGRARTPSSPSDSDGTELKDVTGGSSSGSSGDSSQLLNNASDAANTNRSGDVGPVTSRGRLSQLWSVIRKHPVKALGFFTIFVLFVVLFCVRWNPKASTVDDPFTLCQSAEKMPSLVHPNGTGRFPDEGLYFIPCKEAFEFNAKLMEQVKGKMLRGLWNKDGSIMTKGGEDLFKKYSIHYALAVARTKNVTYEELNRYWGDDYRKVKCFSIAHWESKALPGPLWTCDNGQAAYTDDASPEDRLLFPDQPEYFLHYTQGRVLLFAILHNSEFASLMADIVKSKITLSDLQTEEVNGYVNTLLKLAKEDDREAMVSYMNGEGLRMNKQPWFRRAKAISRSATEFMRRLVVSCTSEFKPEPGQKWADCIGQYEKSNDAQYRRFLKHSWDFPKDESGGVYEIATEDDGNQTKIVKRSSDCLTCSNDDLLDDVFVLL